MHTIETYWAPNDAAAAELILHAAAHGAPDQATDATPMGLAQRFNEEEAVFEAARQAHARAVADARLMVYGLVALVGLAVLALLSR
ncbi:MAG TPA: hypothetical protein VFI96_04740 [Longimicrobiaceae bacterium]|nr:hypothetical protein [Longimicrobiaceae bacterium]